jgi:hypothetical protein
MITINKRSRDFTNVEEYLMTIAPSILSLKDVEDNTVIPVDGMLYFTDTKEDSGDEVEILSIITPDKTVYSCQSKTFKRSLEDIANIMGDNKFSIIKISGKTNNGRDFINCILDVNSVE